MSSATPSSFGDLIHLPGSNISRGSSSTAPHTLNGLIVDTHDKDYADTSSTTQFGDPHSASFTQLNHGTSLSVGGSQCSVAPLSVDRPRPISRRGQAKKRRSHVIDTSHLNTVSDSPVINSLSSFITAPSSTASKQPSLAVDL